MSKKLSEKLTIVEIKTTAFVGENFLLLTTLTELQIKKVIKPIVQAERKGKVFYDNDDLVWSLKEAYPEEIVEMYTTTGIDIISI
jgi:hypothetical protein